MKASPFIYAGATLALLMTAGCDAGDKVAENKVDPAEIQKRADLANKKSGKDLDKGLFPMYDPLPPADLDKSKKDLTFGSKVSGK